MRNHACETCGGPVRVASGDEGTNHYEPDPTPVIRDFVERVNRRAETEMMETGAVEGAHHRAIEAELATFPFCEELGR